MILNATGLRTEACPDLQKDEWHQRKQCMGEAIQPGRTFPVPNTPRKLLITPTQLRRL